MTCLISLHLGFLICKAELIPPACERFSLLVSLYPFSFLLSPLHYLQACSFFFFLFGADQLRKHPNIYLQVKWDQEKLRNVYCYQGKWRGRNTKRKTMWKPSRERGGNKRRGYRRGGVRIVSVQGTVLPYFPSLSSFHFPKKAHDQWFLILTLQMGKTRLKEFAKLLPSNSLVRTGVKI